MNVHFHALFLDGVYNIDEPWSIPRFHPLPELRDEDVAKLTRKLHRRIVRFLKRRYDPQDQEDRSSIEACYAGSIQGRVGLGPKAGSYLQRIGRDPNAQPDFEPGALCSNLEGFSLHAKVRIPARERARLERLCRYVCRPPIATERLSLTDNGKVLYRLRHPFKDGTEAILFEPLVFLERLAALIPAPRLPTVTYHGVLAPAALWRPDIVPNPRPPRVRQEPRDEQGQGSDHETEDGRYYSWAQLMLRVFQIDVLRCPCGSTRYIVAFIIELRTIQAILSHLRLPLDSPTIAPARSPPQPELPYA